MARTGAPDSAGSQFFIMEAQKIKKATVETFAKEYGEPEKV